MNKIDGAGNASGEFTEGNPATSTPATTVTAKWLNQVQREIIAFLTFAGLTPTDADDDQMLDAVKAKFLQLTGGTLTGFLTLHADPNAAMKAATKQYVDANVAPDATTTVKGKVELATDAETQTGTDTVRAITPSNLTARSATTTRTGIAELATAAEVTAGTDPDRIVTPATLGSHPGVIRKSISFGPGTSPAIFKNNGIQSVVRNASGNYTITFTAAFPNADDYIPTGTLTSAQTRFMRFTNQLAGSIDVIMTDTNPNNVDTWDRCNLHFL